MSKTYRGIDRIFKLKKKPFKLGKKVSKFKRIDDINDKPNFRNLMKNENLDEIELE